MMDDVDFVTSLPSWRSARRHSPPGGPACGHARVAWPWYAAVPARGPRRGRGVCDILWVHFGCAAHSSCAPNVITRVGGRRLAAGAACTASFTCYGHVLRVPRVSMPAAVFGYDGCGRLVWHPRLLLLSCSCFLFFFSFSFFHFFGTAGQREPHQLLAMDMCCVCHASGCLWICWVTRPTGLASTAAAVVIMLFFSFFFFFSFLLFFFVFLGSVNFIIYFLFAHVFFPARPPPPRCLLRTWHQVAIRRGITYDICGRSCLIFSFFTSMARLGHLGLHHSLVADMAGIHLVCLA